MMMQAMTNSLDAATEVIANGGSCNAFQQAIILSDGGPSFRGWSREAYVRELRLWIGEKATGVRQTTPGNWEYTINLSGTFDLLMPVDSKIISVVGNKMVVSAGTGEKAYRKFVWYHKAIAGKLIFKRNELYLWEVR